MIGGKVVLKKPSFPISFTFEDTVAMIESLIKSRHWTEFDVAEVKLVYTPYWIFHYDAYLESIDEETGEKTVSDIESGEIALNAATRELNDEVPELLESYPLEKVKKPPEGYKFEVIRPRISEPELKEIAAVKLAHKMNLAKANILISDTQLVFVPSWIVFVTVAEGTYRLNVNAVTGETLGEEEVPERERGWIEVTQETLKELQEPGAWMHYSRALAGGILAAIANAPGIHAFLTNRRLQIFLLIIILVLLLLNLMGYI